MRFTATPIAVAAAGAFLLLPSASFAQGHDHAQMMSQAPATAKAAMADGEVRKLDKARGRVVLKHGPLTALNMPAMTMEFVAKDPKLLLSLKEGDKVRFTPEQGKDGTLIVTTIEVVKG